MLELARSRAPADRERLLMALAEVCERDGVAMPTATRAMVGAVFLDLIRQVECDIREHLAERLAHAAWAPHTLVTTLSRDQIDIARHLIASSPVLEDHDLVRLLVDAAIEHQIEVARRPRLSADLVKVILDQGDSDVLSALAANTTADVTPLAMERLVSFSQTVAGMRAPLARHPRLTLELGATLYTWVGEALKRTLMERYAVDHAAFTEAVDAAIHDAHGAPGDGSSLEVDQRVAMDRRVVQKLKAGGQLRPGLLLRALRDNKLILFTLTLAALGDFTTDQVRLALESESSEMLALACTAVGVDRGALPTIVGLVRELNGGIPGHGNEVATMNRITTLMDKESAARAFRRLVDAKAPAPLF
jgi:uncharacterized protein (DUF2336 family)